MFLSCSPHLQLKPAPAAQTPLFAIGIMACSEPSSGRGLQYFWCVEQQFVAAKAYLYPAQSHEGEVLAEVLAIQPTGDIAVDKKKADAIKKLGSRAETRLVLGSNLG